MGVMQGGSHILQLDKGIFFLEENIWAHMFSELTSMKFYFRPPSPNLIIGDQCNSTHKLR